MTTTPRYPDAEAEAGFDITINWTDRHVVVAGSFDETKAALLVEAIDVLRGASPGPITVDLRDVSHLYTAGLLVLGEACSRQRRSGERRPEDRRSACVRPRPQGPKASSDTETWRAGSQRGNEGAPRS